MTNPLESYNTEHSSPSDHRHWAQSCASTPVTCEILPEEYYKVFYLKIKNGFPFLIPIEIDEYENEIIPFELQKYNLETHFNTDLDRTWVRSHPNGTNFFRENCRSKNYFAHYSYAHSYDRVHLKLQNGQEIKLSNTMNTIMFTSGEESKTIYHNSYDSWVDVTLMVRWYVEEDGTPGPVDPTSWHWRVYGNNPDPWDAPQYMKDQHDHWPPEPRWAYDTLETCYHTSENLDVQYSNIADITEVYSTIPPLEVSIFPAKGHESGMYTENENDVQFIHDGVSTQFKKIRIEKFEDYHRFYISYGDGAPIGGLTGDMIDLLTLHNKWDSKIYGITFDLLSNGTINIVEQNDYYYFPDELNEYIIYDTVLNIYKLLDRDNKPVNIFELLSPSGVEELEKIYIELSVDWREIGYNDFSISLRQQTPLVAKQIEV